MRAASGVAAVAATVLIASPALAAMDVATFIAKGEALKAKGMMAVFSKDLKVVRAEAQAASRGFQADKAARAKAGQPPISCPPPGAKLGAMDFFAELKKIPIVERSMPLKDGMAWVSRRKFPCR
ncbi:MAG: hypothetical protein V4659_06450 [Pseudomonadota bacterium]